MPASPGKSRHPQHERNDPNGTAGLQDEFGPEMQTLAQVKKQSEHRRAARHQISFVPARQIAAGIELQQRIAVPQRGSEQQHKTDEPAGDARGTQSLWHRPAKLGNGVKGHCRSQKPGRVSPMCQSEPDNPMNKAQSAMRVKAPRGGKGAPNRCRCGATATCWYSLKRR